MFVCFWILPHIYLFLILVSGHSYLHTVKWAEPSSYGYVRLFLILRRWSKSGLPHGCCLCGLRLSIRLLPLHHSALCIWKVTRGKKWVTVVGKKVRRSDIVPRVVFVALASGQENNERKMRNIWQTYLQVALELFLGATSELELASLFWWWRSSDDDDDDDAWGGVFFKVTFSTGFNLSHVRGNKCCHTFWFLSTWYNCVLHFESVNLCFSLLGILYKTGTFKNLKGSKNSIDLWSKLMFCFDDWHLEI